MLLLPSLIYSMPSVGYQRIAGAFSEDTVGTKCGDDSRIGSVGKCGKPVVGRLRVEMGSCQERFRDCHESHHGSLGQKEAESGPKAAYVMTRPSAQTAERDSWPDRARFAVIRGRTRLMRMTLPLITVGNHLEKDPSAVSNWFERA